MIPIAWDGSLARRRRGIRIGVDDAIECAALVAVAVEAAIHQTIKGTETKGECIRGVLKKGYILGSKGQRDGKIYYPVEFIECKFFAMEGGKFVEQPKCEVSPIKMNPLAGRLWLEGQESERGTKPLLVLEPETLTEGKPVVAEEDIRNKGGETCGYSEEKYKDRRKPAADDEHSQQRSHLNKIHPPRTAA